MTSHLSEDPEEFSEFVERLRMLCRNRIAQGNEDIKIGKFLIGEDLSAGMIAIDVVGPPMKKTWRIAYGQVSDPKEKRRCFAMIDREGDLTIVAGQHHLLKELEQQMILDELANI